jgi:hypothetical protein
LVSPPPEELERLIHLLADFGSELTNPLIAAACMDVRAIKELLDLGAAIEGNGRWSPLEEAVYWGFEASVKLLLERGSRSGQSSQGCCPGTNGCLARLF